MSTAKHNTTIHVGRLVLPAKSVHITIEYDDRMDATLYMMARLMGKKPMHIIDSTAEVLPLEDEQDNTRPADCDCVRELREESAS